MLKLKALLAVQEGNYVFKAASGPRDGLVYPVAALTPFFLDGVLSNSDLNRYNYIVCATIKVNVTGVLRGGFTIPIDNVFGD